jgi:hypothetical protein
MELEVLPELSVMDDIHNVSAWPLHIFLCCSFCNPLVDKDPFIQLTVFFVSLSLLYRYLMVAFGGSST